MSDSTLALSAVELSRGAILKFQRGVRLASVVRGQIEHFVDDANRTISYKSLLDGRQHIWSIEFESELSSQLPLSLGDALHNWRSSLDHVAGALTCWAGQKPSIQTEFPLGDRLQRLANVPADHCANRIIEIHQPSGWSAGTESSPSDESLYWLHQLDIVDKHRSLIFAGPGIDIFSLALPEPDMRVEITGWRVHSALKWEFLARSERNVNLEDCATFNLYVGLPYSMTQRDNSDVAGERPNLNVLYLLDDIEGNVRQVLIDSESLIKLGGVWNACPRLGLQEETNCARAQWSCLKTRVQRPIEFPHDPSG